MFENRDLVIAGAAAPARRAIRATNCSRPFNERVRRALPADTPFTSTSPSFMMRCGIIAPAGRTALFDAVLAGLDY
jgi:hypothetical protein